MFIVTLLPAGERYAQTDDSAVFVRRSDCLSRERVEHQSGQPALDLEAQKLFTFYAQRGRRKGSLFANIFSNKMDKKLTCLHRICNRKIKTKLTCFLVKANEE